MSLDVNETKVENLINEGYTFSPTKVIGEAFTVVNKNAGLFIGFTVVFWLASGLAGFIEGLILPNISLNIFSRVLTAVMVPGYFIVANYYMNKRRVDFNQFFEGFQSAGRLIGVGILVQIISFLPILPAMVSAFLNDNIVEQYMEMIMLMQQGEFYLPVISLTTILLFFGGMLLSIYLSVSYTLSIPIVLFSKMGVWQGMEASRRIVSKKWFNFFGFSLLNGLLTIAGAMLLVIGLLYFFPVVMVAVYIAYRSIFNIEGDESDDEWIEHLVEE